MLSDAVELEEEMNNSDSQQSNNDSTASLMDSDVEGDTIASQQTTATEITMPIQSAASLVLPFDPKQRSKLTVVLSMLKTFVFDYASLYSKFRQIKPAYRCQGFK